MSKSRIILSIVLLCCIMTGVAVCFMLYMPHGDIQHEDTVIVSPVELIEAYQIDEASANQKYLGKVLQVTGIVESIETTNEGQVVVILPGNTPIAGVRCSLTKNQSAETGSAVTLKGRCTGYLSDVIMIDCLLIK